MARAVKLNCPSCGAPLPQGSTDCDFCGARLEFPPAGNTLLVAALACPECRSLNPPSRRYCGKCGAQLVQVCLNCAELNPIGLEYCGHCGLTSTAARRRAAKRFAASARREGWYQEPTDPQEHTQLLAELAAPDETPIVLVTDMLCDVDPANASLLHRSQDDCRTVDFVVTDQSFMFVSSRFRFPDDSLRRIPFERVKALDVDDEEVTLLITFDGGQACVSIPAYESDFQYHRTSSWPSVCRATALRIVSQFRVFLPPHLQRVWYAVPSG